MAGDAQAGRLVADRECKGCHGLDGAGGLPAVPRLDGQRERYMIRALDAYKTGRRQHTRPPDRALKLSDVDQRNVAAYYATVTASPGALTSVAAPSRAESSRDAIAAQCDRCHDADDAAVPAPKLHGQRKEYLANVMRAYRDSGRDNSTMHRMIASYPDATIDAVATWYGSPPAH